MTKMCDVFCCTSQMNVVKFGREDACAISCVSS